MVVSLHLDARRRHWNHPFCYLCPPACVFVRVCARACACVRACVRVRVSSRMSKTVGGLMGRETAKYTRVDKKRQDDRTFCGLMNPKTEPQLFFGNIGTPSTLNPND
jgi:hypothetical protein